MTTSVVYVDTWMENKPKRFKMPLGEGFRTDVTRKIRFPQRIGNSPTIIFKHYRELVTEEAAAKWFSMMPPHGWVPPEEERQRWPKGSRKRR